MVKMTIAQMKDRVKFFKEVASVMELAVCGFDFDARHSLFVDYVHPLCTLVNLVSKSKVKAAEVAAYLEQAEALAILAVNEINEKASGMLEFTDVNKYIVEVQARHTEIHEYIQALLAPLPPLPPAAEEAPAADGEKNEYWKHRVEVRKVPTLENGDPVEYRYTTIENDTWQAAVFHAETRLYWFLLDDDGELRDYLKDRVEIRKSLGNCPDCGSEDSEEFNGPVRECTSCGVQYLPTGKVNPGKEPSDDVDLYLPQQYNARCGGLSQPYYLPGSAGAYRAARNMARDYHRIANEAAQILTNRSYKYRVEVDSPDGTTDVFLVEVFQDGTQFAEKIDRVPVTSAQVNDYGPSLTKPNKTVVFVFLNCGKPLEVGDVIRHQDGTTRRVVEISAQEENTEGPGWLFLGYISDNPEAFTIPAGRYKGRVAKPVISEYLKTDPAGLLIQLLDEGPFQNFILTLWNGVDFGVAEKAPVYADEDPFLTGYCIGCGVGMMGQKLRCENCEPREGGQG